MPHDDADAGDDDADSVHDGADADGAEPDPTADSPLSDASALAIDIPDPEELTVDLPDPDAFTDALPVPEPLSPAVDIPDESLQGYSADLRQAQTTLEQLDATVGPHGNPAWARKLQATSHQLTALAETVNAASTVTMRPVVRDLQRTARTIAARQSVFQSQFGAAVRSSMGATAALSGMAAVTVPTMTGASPIDPAFFQSMVEPTLQQAAAPLQAMGTVPVMAVPSVEPLLAMVRQPAFQQLVEMIESLAAVRAPVPATVIDEEVFRQARRVAEQLDGFGEELVVSSADTAPAGTAPGQPSGPESIGRSNQHGFWSPVQAPAAPTGSVGQGRGTSGIPQRVVTEMYAHSAAITGTVVGGATGLGFHHLSQLYPSQQATLGYVEPVVGVILGIAVTLALAED